MPAPTPESLFDARVTGDPASPLLTFYDDATGERAELSAKSLGNWVAKTHFLLLDELGCAVGDRAFVALPPHWLAAPILLGCWFAGLEVVSDPASAAVAFADAESIDRLGGALSKADEVFAVSLLSMARPAPPPPGATDFTTAVRPQPDNWATVRAQAGHADTALDGADRAAVAERAAGIATELGLTEGGRLMWTAREFGPDAWLATLVAPLTVHGSAVLVHNGEPGRLETRAMSERVTVTR